MNDLTYTSASGATVVLDGDDCYVGTANELRSSAWSYELTAHGLSNASRTAREAELTLYASFEKLDRLRRLCDADMAAGAPGTFTAQSEWSQSGFVVSRAVEGVCTGWSKMTVTAVLLDGCWWRTRKMEFLPGSGTEDGRALGYDYGYSYDYGRSYASRLVNTGCLSPCKPLITVYGPCIDPYLILGGNRYQVDVTVPGGGYLVIDGRAKTVLMTDRQGAVTDCFAAAHRGLGEGKGEYVFQPIGRGDNLLAWDDSFGVDVGWYEEEGEPPWTLT